MTAIEDPDTIADAIAYVIAVHRDVTGENGAPPLGVQGEAVEALLADPAATHYVRDWAKRVNALEASVAPAPRPPIDDVYRRVAAILKRGEGEASGKEWR